MKIHIGELDSHQHCFHLSTGVIHMVIPSGYILEECCECHETRLVHSGHSWIRKTNLKPYSMYC